jgi:uncharacterized membrane protein
MPRESSRTSLAAVLFGVGFGGFADGILLHQILQWHHMLSSVLPPTAMPEMEINMRWDGFFHVLVWAVSLSGAFVLWGAGRRGHRFPNFWQFGGWMIFGWGLFNFFEGLINHHLLGIHHVRYAGDAFGAEPSLGWGLGFVLVGGLGFLLIGWLLARHGVRAEQRAPSLRS